MNTDISVNNILLIQQGELQIATGKSLTSHTDFINTASGLLTNNGNLYIKGNVMNDQPAMAPGSGTVYFNGLLGQTIAGTQPFVVNNLFTDNGSGFVLNNNMNVAGLHTFSTGVITTSSTPNYLIYQSGSSCTGNGDGAHVNGWVKKLGSTDFSFPLGNGTYGRSIGITGVSGASEFNARYNRPVTPNTTQLDDSLVFVNSSEYWSIHKISGANAYVTMDWDNSKIAFPQLRLTDIRAAYYDGIRWNSLGGSATGDVLTTGTITSAIVSAMNNYYTLGSISFVLPMHLISFTARRNADVSDVDWKVDEEQNVRQYELERSDDGIYFYTINRQLPKNLNRVELYSYSDRKAVSSTVFYRLKITTSSSKVIYSQIVVISVNAHKSGLRIITNPVQDKIDIYASDQAAGQYWYSIISTSGQVMQSGSLEVKYSGVYSIPLRSTLSAGVYCIQMQSEVSSLKQLIIKK
ncbi:MAG: hypothetical protein IPP72_16395 [Chitinophagaceae bacterium]|nr:hypothetical protein [Chitinophagaceae bacterium]